MAKTSVKEFKLVNVELLVPYANNARTHPKEQIKKIQSSLREFGFINPLIIDREHNVLAGHGRLAAAKAEGYKEVPCVFVEDLTEAQKKAYIIADNRMALDAGWDEELLAVELEGLSDLGFDLSLTGFDEKEISDLFKTDGDVEDDDYDLSEALEEASFVERNDRWIVGRHVLVCGDATNAEDMKKLCGSTLVDLTLTDPPYNVNIGLKGEAYEKREDSNRFKNRKLLNDNLSDVEFLKFLTDAFQNMHNYSKKGAAIYVFHADSEGYNFRKAFKDAGYDLKQTLIWVKNSLVLGRQDYQWQHEPILYGWKSGASHSWYGDRKQTTVIKYDRPLKSAEHPTMKPIELCGYLIKNSSKEGDIVLDPFGGSGSTMIACEQLNRTCYMLELDPKYASVILRRYVENTGDADNVYCIRNGQKVAYADVVKQVDGSSDNSSTNDLI